MINDRKIKTVQDKIRLAICQIEIVENVKIEFGSVRYNVAQYSTQMSVKTLEKTESVDNVFKSLCARLGFTQNIIGMKFESTGGLYEIVDIQTKNRKYPIIAVSPKGTRFKYSVTHIKKLIGGDKIINRNANLEKLING